MSSYRFCRTDDIGLLVDALNRCWAPYVPGEPLTTPETFKRSIRELQVCPSRRTRRTLPRVAHWEERSAFPWTRVNAIISPFGDQLG